MTPSDIAETAVRWCREGEGWRLVVGRRRMGRVVPDKTYSSMWRPVLSRGRLGDMANLSWARSAVYEAALRELEWEVHRKSATAPRFTGQNGGVFQQAAPPMRFSEAMAVQVPPPATRIQEAI